LYLIAGEVCGLLSLISWDLGNADMAEEQARAAHTYGNVIDHPSLCAWARALQVTVAFWSRRPREATEVATGALASAPPGTARVRLHSVNARALALIGARQEVITELNAAARELDRAGDDPFLDEIGGELSFDRSRHALCTASAYVALGDGEQAEPAAMTAIELFAGLPEDLRGGTGELGAWIDLGTARALRGNLAGAEEALHQVFALAPERRTEALARRLTDLGRVLATTKYRGAVEAIRMGEAIEDFTSNRLARSAARRLIGPTG
jgi:tetratricopeptide (TPR) repeat protein